MTKLTLPPKLLKMGLDSPKALVLHLPARYEDETELWPIDEALEQGRFTAVQTQGTVLACQVVFRPRRQLLVTIEDHTGLLHLRWLNFAPTTS